MPNFWRDPGDDEESMPDGRWELVKNMELFTFFWHGAFSNWYMSEFIIKGISYCCVEQFMMAQKALVFGDHDSYKLIMASRDPKEMKALGRGIKNFDGLKWHKVRKPIVKMAVMAKFRQNGIIYERLKATIGTTLVEASPYDDIWGIKLGADDPRAQARETWLGLNLLGEILTEAREELMAEDATRMVVPAPVQVLIDSLPFVNGKVYDQGKEWVRFEIDTTPERYQLFKLAYDGCIRVVEEDCFKTDNSSYNGNRFIIVYKPLPKPQKEDRKMRFENRKKNT